MHLAEEVDLLVNLVELLLKLDDVFFRVWIELFELFASLLQSLLLVRLPGLCVFKLDLRLENVKLLSEFL